MKSNISFHLYIILFSGKATEVIPHSFQEEEHFVDKLPPGLFLRDTDTHSTHTKRYTMFGVRKAINNVQVFEPSCVPLGISYTRPILYCQLPSILERNFGRANYARSNSSQEMSRIKQKAYRGWLL